MPTPISPQEFVAKWRQVTANEKKMAQEHFIDLCHLIGHPTPLEADPKGEWFTFEAGANKSDGGHGFADVWYRGKFAWEYKGKHANLERAYAQLCQYREALQFPPLLIVSDIDHIEIHTNFTNTVKRVITLTLDDLLTPQGIDQLKTAFENPQVFKAQQTTEQVTRQAAEEFGRLAELLRQWGVAPQPAAHFLIRVLFCLFAEDIGLLPSNLFSRMVKKSWMRPADLTAQLRELFGKMSKGGWFGADEILHFNGGLFDDDVVFDLDSDSLSILGKISDLDWSSIEPSIFGTLFERSLDPSKRSQIGAHYTSKEDILLIVEPVLMTPLRRRWAEIEKETRAIAAERDAIKSSQTTKRNSLTTKIRVLLMNFDAELRRLRVLDPACGSANFLYVSLRQLLDLEKKVITLASELGVGQFAPEVGPEQLYGIEVNPYAHELAQATVWIGYIQWLRENGYGRPSEPILKRLDNIKRMDAIMQTLEVSVENSKAEVNDKTSRVSVREPEWVDADVIVGNPPFLGDKKMRAELGDKYVDDLRALYADRIPGQSDLVCYWFEKARAMIEQGKVKRAGLLATNSIRDGSNRAVLERVKKSGDIFMAWSDRDWILDGAAVNVSMVGFDNGEEKTRALDGKPVAVINSDLSMHADVTQAKQLQENIRLCFLGMMKGGPFDIDEETARKMLDVKGNPNKRPNTDVVKRRLGARDITSGTDGGWIIDFVDMPLEQAAQYEAPFEYVKKHIKPIRDKVRDSRMKAKWWLHGRSRPELRTAIKGMNRCIVTPEVSKHRVFVWMPTNTIPDHTCHVIAREDDYFFGILHSHVHELWSLSIGSTLEDRPRYSSSRTFEAFPFPFPPGKEPRKDARVKQIAQAAKELVEQRDRWLNPERPEGFWKPFGSEPKRTLTNLYNARPEWLAIAHRKLDDAVLDAYGWKHDLSDEEILERLLKLNLAR